MILLKNTLETIVFKDKPVNEKAIVERVFSDKSKKSEINSKSLTGGNKAPGNSGFTFISSKRSVRSMKYSPPKKLSLTLHLKALIGW